MVRKGGVLYKYLPFSLPILNGNISYKSPWWSYKLFVTFSWIYNLKPVLFEDFGGEGDWL